MPFPQGPLLPRRRLGAELRRLRSDRTLEDVAAQTLISTSKLSRLENGQGVPQPRDIRDLINFYHADRPTSDRLRRWMTEGRRQAWWREYSDVIRESFEPILDYESGASLIRTYTPTILPGLLQTRSYARQLLMALNPQLTAEHVAKLVEVRLRRQEILTAEEDSTRLLGVVDEAAVHRVLAMDSPDDAREQLEHLREISKRRNVSVRVLPFSAGLHSAMDGGFAVFQFSDDIDRDVVYIETHAGDRSLEEPASVLEYIRLFDAVTQRSLDNPESRDLLTRLVESLPRSQEKK